MTERSVTVGHRLGLHARAAAQVVQLSNGFASDIVLRRAETDDHREADARSILSILFLAAGYGSTVVVRADGADEAEAADSICAYLKG
jgi:phosphotransferase system HPr (HPr) family protein